MTKEEQVLIDDAIAAGSWLIEVLHNEDETGESHTEFKFDIEALSKFAQLQRERQEFDIEPDVVIHTGNGIFYSTHTVHAQKINGQWKLQVRLGQLGQPPCTNDFVLEGCELFTAPPQPQTVKDALEQAAKRCDASGLEFNESPQSRCWDHADADLFKI